MRAFIKLIRRWRARRAELQRLADYLHHLDAWHCDCFFHRGERAVEKRDLSSPELYREVWFGVPVVTAKKEKHT